ncbi:unnamed protein product [Brassica rapa subsp. narinosa]
MTMFNTPMSLLSLTEDVTRTFVPSEQLRVNIERDRGLEEGTAAQVKIKMFYPSDNNHGKLKLGSYETYDREIKAGACLKITKRRGWSIVQLQWNIYA